MKKEKSLLQNSLEFLKKISFRRKEEKTSPKKNKGLIYAILIIGIVLLTVPSFVPEKEDVNAPANIQYEPQYEREIKNILSVMEGVGECEVMVSYKSSKEYVIAKDKTRDNSGSEEKNVITGSGSGEKPFIIREEMPIVMGVVVVCSGGGDEKIRNNVTEAVCALCGIGPGKVKVYKK